MGPSELLIGRWRLLNAEGQPDTESIIEVEFCPGGVLRHSIRIGAGEHLAELGYRIQGDEIISTALEGDGENRTAFAFDDAGQLRLQGMESVSWYARSDEGS